MDIGDPVIVKRLRTKSIELLPIYDIHYGSEQCQERALKKIIDYIKKTPSCFTFLGGDIIECAIYGKMNNVHEQKRQVDEQIAGIVRMLKPIRHKIIFMICGNHEARVEKATGINIAKLIADMIEIPYIGWEAHFLLKLRNLTIRCYAHHGASSAATSGGKLNAIEKLHFRSPFAHMIFAGHTHFPLKSEKEIRYIDGTGKFRTFVQTFISSGSLHKSDGYAGMKAYAPLPTHLNKTKMRNIRGKLVVEMHGF